MPEFSFGLGRGINPTTVDIGGLEVPTVYVGREGAWLHRPGADPERFDPRARVLASGTIETEHFAMSGLTEIFGVAVEAVWPDGTDASAYCRLQVSLDNGETYLAWTGAAWEEQATDEVYNTLEDFNDHCDSLPLANQGTSAGGSRSSARLTCARRHWSSGWCRISSGTTTR